MVALAMSWTVAPMTPASLSSQGVERNKKQSPRPQRTVTQTNPNTRQSKPKHCNNIHTYRGFRPKDARHVGDELHEVVCPGGPFVQVGQVHEAALVDVPVSHLQFHP